MAEKYLRIPLTEENVRKLEIGDIVFLDGPIFTGRSLFHIRAIEHGIIPPVNFEQVNVLMHAGPMVKKADDSWRVILMTPTASIRFEKYGAAIIEKLRLRAIVGKTTMGTKTIEMMKRFGAVHLASTGIMTNILPNQVKKILNVYFLEELGRTEATWVIELEKSGPFIVDIDANGNNLFHYVNKEVEDKFKTFYKKFGISRGFKYTNVNL